MSGERIEMHVGAVYRRGRVWWYDGTWEGGRVRFSLKTRSRVKAISKARDYEARRLTGQRYGIEIVEIDEVLDLYEHHYLDERGNRESAWQRSSSTIRRFLDWLTAQGVKDVRQVQARHFLDFRSMLLDDGLSRATANKYQRTLRAMWTWAVREGYAEENVFDYRHVRSLKTIKRQRVTHLDEEQAEALKEYAVESGPWWMLVYYYTGVRMSEGLALDWSDVDLDRGLVLVREKPDFQPKDYEERSIPISESFRELLEPRVNTTDALVHTSKGEPYRDSRALYYRFEKASKELGFRVRPQLLRRTFASVLFQRCKDVRDAKLEQISRYLGHDQLSTTRRWYVEIVDDTSTDLVDLL